ncbi:MAG: HMA2 domain-containing protein [Liquorilactobacillus ghanensis]|uniref:HMA2 domain-containing protein n=1 Tax=Liquorilactobacillus ghanensis TaxID=399370 RepID=UPI0039EA8FB2
MNKLLSFGLMTVGMSGYKKLMRTQNIKVVYANSYRLRLQSNRWKNKNIHAYVKQRMAEFPEIETVAGSAEIGTLLFNFKKASFTQQEFDDFLNELVKMTDEAYQEAPVTALNRLYDGKQKVDHLLKRASLGLIDSDTLIFSYSLVKGIRAWSSHPQAALSFLWWSYSILDRVNRKREK